MVTAREHFPRFTPEEYFVWEKQQLHRHEYIDGEVYAMSGGTQNHSDIAMNFRDDGCSKEVEDFDDEQDKEV